MVGNLRIETLTKEFMIQSEKIKTPSMPILTHICAWGLLIGIMVYASQQPVPAEAVNRVPHLGEIVSMVSFIITFFYINYAWLIPRFYYQQGLRQYGVALFCTWLIFAAISSIVGTYISNEPFMLAQFLISIVPFGFLNGMGFAIRLVGERNKQEKERRERENETLKSELSFLRSQISPHFLFNIMNSIVSMSHVKPELVGPTLIQLSQLMRYMLYESDESKVSIEKEIAYLESYISLQKMRFGRSINIIVDNQIEVKNDDYTEGSSDVGFGMSDVGTFPKSHIQNPISKAASSFLIEPMLLIPFVENAFKHGMGMIREPFIKIDISLKSNQLIFNVLNKFNDQSEEQKDFDSGIGLKNVTRRLALVYGHNHALKAEAEGDLFVVNLTINLKK
jgi:two-component system, LytTR family, sensor kinase